MMKLADINTIKLGYPRTTSSKVQKAVPYSYPQRQDTNIEDEEDEEEEVEGSVEDIEGSIEKYNKLIQMANSWAPFKDTVDIRNPPNKPDTVGV